MGDTQLKSNGSFFTNAYLLLTLAPLIWAGNAVFGKLATNELNAIELTFFRWFVAVIFMFFIIRPHLKRDWPVIKQYWCRLFFMGAFGFVGFNLALYNALQHTTAINVAIAQSAIPVVIILLNRALFKNQIFVLQVVGVLLAIAGVVFTVSKGDLSALIKEGTNRGDALMFVAVLCYALYSVSLRYKPKINDFSFIFSLAVVSLITMLPLMLYSVSVHSFPEMSGTSIGIILFIAIFPSFFAQLFYAKGVAKIGANRGGIFINLVPIFGTLLAVIILKEQLHSYHLLGLALVLSGIAMAEWVVRRKTSNQ